MPSSSTHHTSTHPHSHSHSHSQKQYYLITNVNAPPSSKSSSSSSSSSSSKNKKEEFDLAAQSWKLPYTIDDSDLTFDGKPLNMLYEENRYYAEHSYNDYASGGERKSRGRSKSKK